MQSLTPSLDIFYFFGYSCEPGWPLTTPDPRIQSLASHRLRGLLPALELAGRGHHIHVLAGHDEARHELDGDPRRSRLLIGKLTHPNLAAYLPLVQAALAMIESAKSKRIPVIVDYTDDLVGRNDHRSRPTLQLLMLADRIVCSSDLLASKVRRYVGEGADVCVIPDPIEADKPSPPRDLSKQAAEPIKVLWFGHESNLDPMLALLLSLNEVAQEHRLELEIVTKLPSERLLELQLIFLGSGFHYLINFTEWESQDTVFSALRRSHVVLIPVDPLGPKVAASSNRLTESLWAGCFVVASPIPSYESFRDIAWLGSDLTDGLRWYLQHRELAASMVTSAQHRLSSTLTRAHVADLWECAIDLETIGES